MYRPFPRYCNLTEGKDFHSHALTVLTEYTCMCFVGLIRCFAVFHIAYLLHGSAENTVALVIRYLNRPQKLNAESLNPCWISFHAYRV